MRIPLACITALLGACAVDPSGLPAEMDGGPVLEDMRRSDARPGDMRPSDMPMADMPPTDMPPTDMPPTDMPPTDMPMDQGFDMGPPDMGPPDMGPPDMGPPDMGPPDMGPPDMGPPDMGPCGMPEVCNAVDDDCDGRIDENPGGPRGENACDACERRVSPSGTTYQFCGFSLNWVNARNACRLSNYELASIPNSTEDGFIDSQLGTSNDWWIGLNDIASEGTFEWEEGATDRPLSGYEDWAIGEPNNDGNQDCVRIETFGGFDVWRTSGCDDGNYFVCEAM